MGYKITAPLCRDGSKKNHKSTIGDVVVQWVEGVAEVTEADYNKVKPRLEGIGGYGFGEDSPKETVDPSIAPDTDPESRSFGTEVTTLPDAPVVVQSPTPEPEKKSRMFGMVSVENTISEIKAFAGNQNPPIQLGKARTKPEMIAVIEKHFK